MSSDQAAYVQVQIENHLGNLPEPQSVNKFRFTTSV